MSNDDEINEVLAQLRDLHIQQAVLVDRFIRLTDRDQENERRAADRTVIAPDQTETRQFRLGDHVRITNPTFLQFNQGVIKKIGVVRITVESDTGKTLTRLPKNLTLLHP